MLPNITVIKEIDNLHQEEWSFWLDDRIKQFVLDRFISLKKESTRHKFKVVDRWSRLDQRNNNNPKPVVPSEIAAQARAQFMSMITFEGE